MRAHKIREQRMHSEIVYYDDEGAEVGREEVFDDHLYDTDPPEELTDDEREDWL
jgi:hypothetical protein